jgi:predicted nucleic acid-binding protein
MSATNYGWDSSVFIAWLCEEQTAPLADMDLVAKDIDASRANLIVSVTTYSEILVSKYDEMQLDRLNKFLSRSNVIRVDTTAPIAIKAGKIRDTGLLYDGRKIKMPDATIIAVAILHKANVLHTLDGGMLSLNGTSIVDNLPITKPCLFSGQRSLFNGGYA